MNARGTAADLDGRVERLRAQMRDEAVTTLVVFDPRNIRYLTGFTGSSGVVVVGPEETLLVSDFRYRLQAREEAPQARFVEIADPLSDVLPDLLPAEGGIGIEATRLTVAEWKKLEPGLAARPVRLVDGWVERLREIKSPAEIAAVKAAAEIVTGMLEHLTGMRVVGRSERDVALELEIWARRQGSEPVPFPLIVAAGPRGAMPHAEVTDRPIQAGQLLVVDIGAAVDGYAADVTRTFATGPLGTRELEIYETVARAQRSAREAAKAGIGCAELDAQARRTIAEAGYGESFKHSLGHGVGLDVHEGPRLSARSEEVLAAGMVVTIEPGIYVEGLGGVRIEDTVVVTAGGADVLSMFPHSLITLV